MAWLTEWNRRKSKTIDGSSAGIQTDYQMKLTVHKSTGTDTATDIYLGTNVRDDFGDVRFTQSDGTTLLDYWIESYTPGSVAIFWIKVPSIPANPDSLVIYVYYDNSLATNLSNGMYTFPLFDHFEGTSLDSKWVHNNPGGSVTVSNSKVTISGVTLGDWAVWRTSGAPKKSIPLVAEFYGKIGSQSGDHHEWFGIGDFSEPNYAGNDWAILGYFTWANSYESGNNGVSKNTARTTNLTSWTHVKIILNGTTVQYYENDVLTRTHTTSVPDAPMGLAMGVANPGAVVTLDYAFLRNYASPEPVFSATGEEELPVGNLYIYSTPPGASIYIDDILQQELTPLLLTNIPAGIHTYKLTLTNYFDAEGIFEISNQQTTTVDITLIQKIGILDISSNPLGAEIFIDNIDIGLTTPLLLTNILAGSHTYKLTIANYYDAEGIFDIATNRTTTIFVDLIPICVPNWLCEQPLNGYESDSCGNRRLNSLCNPCVPNWRCEQPFNGYEYDSCGNRRQNPKCSIQPLMESIEQFAASGSFLLMFGTAVVGVILIRKNHKIASLKKRKYR